MGYTSEQLHRRNTSKWTPVQAVGALVQFIVFAISLILVIRLILTGQGFELTTFFVVLKVLMLYFMTITGMAWEKEVFGQYFLAKEFFWEDMGNLLSLAGNTFYLATLLLGADKNVQVAAMCVALATYVVNFLQFARRGLRSARMKRAAARASLGATPASK